MPLHDQPPSAFGEVEWRVLDLLLDRQELWGVGELVDRIGSPIAVAEALDALDATSLIERSGAFIRLAAI
jgi:hypothetical protein